MGGALVAPGHQTLVSMTHRASVHLIPLGAFHSGSFSESQGQLHTQGTQGTQIWGSRTYRLPIVVLSHWPGQSWGPGSR